MFRKSGFWTVFKHEQTIVFKICHFIKYFLHHMSVMKEKEIENVIVFL